MRFASSSWLAAVIVVVVVVVVVVVGVEAQSVAGFVKGFSGRYLEGVVTVSLEGVSLVRCAAVCGPLGVFNVQGSWPTYICHVLASFTAFVEDPRYSVYYDMDLYRGSGFFHALGLSLFMPPASSPKVAWLDAYWDCKNKWMAFMVPQTQAEWEWMKKEAERAGGEGMWLGLQEGKEGGKTYAWMGLYMTDAPGPVNVTLPDDGITIYNEDTEEVVDDFYDCGALVKASTGQKVAIKNCYEALYAAYICEALFPPPL